MSFVNPLEQIWTEGRAAIKCQWPLWGWCKAQMCVWFDKDQSVTALVPL